MGLLVLEAVPLRIEARGVDHVHVTFQRTCVRFSRRDGDPLELLTKR